MEAHDNAEPLEFVTLHVYVGEDESVMSCVIGKFPLAAVNVSVLAAAPKDVVSVDCPPEISGRS
jgi:hypothetical protein